MSDVGLAVDDSEDTSEIVDAEDAVDLDVEDVLLLEDAEPELVLPVWEPTGDAAVDAALEELGALDDRATADHVDVFTNVHRALHARLVDLET